MKVEITIAQNKGGYYECSCGEKHFSPFIHISKGKLTTTYEFEAHQFTLIKSMFDTFGEDIIREFPEESMYKHSDGYKK